jgi:putative flippase GtrA
LQEFAARDGDAAERDRWLRKLVQLVDATGASSDRAHYLAAAAAGAGAGALTDFTLKRHWAFDRASMAPVHREGARYLAVSGASLLLNLALSYALVDGLHLPAVPGVIAASLVVGFVWNYPLHRWFVFRAHARPAAAIGPRPAAGEGEP